MIILLASLNCIASHSNEVAPSDTVRKLLSFEEIKLNQHKKHRESNENSLIEERGAAAVIGGNAAGNTPTMPKKKDEDSRMVTVTKYNNNGVLQWFQRWIARMFGSHSKSSNTRRLRQ
ncbi:hypothetical protein AM587_10004839 [Phytophthora nicotianae]|uniref:RxLR effector protein n=1 Tax=Phytophthora nicotianae TaxID=4792 RepID=A0A0W8DZU2_PHYNI|nr:hypothetical protein AM587_10004839 [Phytophthora nicotianae]